MRFCIKIVMDDNKEYRLEDLNERETQETLARAYNDILDLKEKIRFTDDLVVDALELNYFCIE